MSPSTTPRPDDLLAALREDAENLRSLLDNAHDFVVYRVEIDPEAPHGGHVVLVSPSIRDLLGIRDPFRFEAWFENVHPDDEARIEEANKAAWEQGVPYDQAARFWHKQRAEWVWVRTMSTPVFDDAGRLSHFNGLVLDISDQMAAESALQAQIDFNNIVTAISTRFINLPLDEVDAGMQWALETVGLHTGVDRSYVFMYAGEPQTTACQTTPWQTMSWQTMSCRYEWCAEGIPPQIAHLQDLPMKELAWSNEVLLRGHVLHVPRVADLPPEAAAERAEFSAQGIRSLVAVPMVYRGATVGFLGFDAVAEEKTWSDESIKLLRIVGEILVNGLEHRRAETALHEAYRTLEERVAERTHEIEERRLVAEGLSDILTAINANEPLDTILDRLVSQAARHLGASACVLDRLDSDRQELVRTATHGWPEDIGALPTTTFDRLEQAGASAYVTSLLSRQPTYGNYGPLPARLDEVERDPSLPPEIKARKARIRSHFAGSMGVPLIVANQVYGGLIFYYAEPQNFENEQVQLALTFAQQAELAIENASLRSRAGQAAVAEERNRIARELHDSVSQALYGIALGTRTARTLLDRADVIEGIRSSLAAPLDYTLSLAEAGLAEMRALIFELRPDALETEGLVAALRKQAEALRARHKLDVQAQFCDEPPLPFAVKEAFYRVAQEALNNIVKHAHAKRVALTLTCDAETLALEVSDDGMGFDAGAEHLGHLGLLTMRERLEKLGGRLAIRSAQGEGTRVLASLSLGDCPSLSHPPTEDLDTP